MVLYFLHTQICTVWRWGSYPITTIVSYLLYKHINYPVISISSALYPILSHSVLVLFLVLACHFLHFKSETAMFSLLLSSSMFSSTIVSCLVCSKPSFSLRVDFLYTYNISVLCAHKILILCVHSQTHSHTTDSHKM